MKKKIIFLLFFIFSKNNIFGMFDKLIEYPVDAFSYFKKTYDKIQEDKRQIELLAQFVNEKELKNESDFPSDELYEKYLVEKLENLNLILESNKKFLDVQINQFFYNNFVLNKKINSEKASVLNNEIKHTYERCTITSINFEKFKECYNNYFKKLGYQFENDESLNKYLKYSNNSKEIFNIPFKFSEQFGLGNFKRSIEEDISIIKQIHIINDRLIGIKIDKLKAEANKKQNEVYEIRAKLS